jgi:hypothetical protein
MVNPDGGASCCRGPGRRAASSRSASGCWLLAPIAAGQQATGDGPPVTAETLAAKIAETEAAPDLPEETKTRLLSLYRRASSNLEAAAAERAAAQAFRESLQEAPAEAQAIRERLTAASGAESADPLAAGLPVNERTPLADLETFIQQDRGDLALTEQLLADLSRQLDEATARPAAIRQRLQAAEQEQTENLAQQQLVAASGEASAEAQARRWALETHAEALAAEIERLDQELLSQPARVELLEAKRDKAARNAAAIGRRLAHLEDLITQRRQADAERAKAAAEAQRLEAEGRHPLVVRLAEQNAALSGDIADTVTQLDEIRLRPRPPSGCANNSKATSRARGRSSPSAAPTSAASSATCCGSSAKPCPICAPSDAKRGRARSRRARAASSACCIGASSSDWRIRTPTVATLLAEAGVDAVPTSTRARLVELVDERRRCWTRPSSQRTCCCAGSGSSRPRKPASRRPSSASTSCSM